MVVVRRQSSKKVCCACRMSRLKKRAREVGARQKGRVKERKVQEPMSLFELSITISVGGGDMD